MTKIKILSTEEINKGLKELSEWVFKDDKISKTYKFKDFMDSLGFVIELAPYFEKMDHHADVSIMYSRVRFELNRFDVGGKVTDLDLTVAREIEKHYNTRK